MIKGFTLFSPHLSLTWHLPHQGEDFKNIANGFAKNAMKLHFTKSFTKFFSKNFQGLGWNPKVFQFDKYKFIVSLNPSVKPSVCHLPFQGRLSSWEGSHERGAVTQWLRGYDFSSINLYFVNKNSPDILISGLFYSYY